MENTNNQGNSDGFQEWLKKNRAEILDWAKYIVAAILIAILLSNFVIVNANIPSESMVSTIMPGDRVIASRLHFAFGQPKRGDIVIFRYPDDEKVLFVKRLMGVPGDTLEIRDGILYINGAPQKEPYVRERMEGNFGPYTVPKGKYFMMGDNRNNSRDSRFWNNKFVARDKILGKVIFEYYPKIKFFGF